MLEGVNDTPRHAAELTAILDEKTFNVNLIPTSPPECTAGRHAMRSPPSSTYSIGRVFRQRCASRVVATSLRHAGSSPSPADGTRVLRILGIPIAADDARALVASLIAETRGVAATRNTVDGI